jgi:copper homeostasis protein CutC
MMVHLLVFHTAEVLDTYETSGLCVEDAVESIHAIMNVLRKKRRTILIMRGAGARKESKTAELESKMAAGKSTSHKKRRVQGASKVQCEDMYIDCM